MNKLKNDDYFTTSDVYLAASLSVLGHLPISIDRDEPTRCRFVFDNTPILQEKIDNFWRRKLALEPQALFSALRSLKWQLYNN